MQIMDSSQYIVHDTIITVRKSGALVDAQGCLVQLAVNKHAVLGAAAL